VPHTNCGWNRRVLHVMAGHSASKTRVNALLSRPSTSLDQHMWTFHVRVSLWPSSMAQRGVSSAAIDKAMQQTSLTYCNRKRLGTRRWNPSEQWALFSIAQEPICAMCVVAQFWLVSSSVSGTIASQRTAKCLRAVEAIQQSQATLLRIAFVAHPSWCGTCLPGPGAETSVARRYAI
jgi:hypothetical protein